jgi:predicted CXXCH cytochrome family protein
MGKGPPEVNCRIIMKNTAKVVLFFAVVAFLQNGCTEPLGDGLPGSDSNNSTYHSTGWKDDPQHGNDYSTEPQNCKACHGEDLDGGSSGISCDDCHHDWTGTHADAFNDDPTSCQPCHGDSISFCADCHHSGWTGTHGEEYAANADNCKACHGDNLDGDEDQDRNCGHCHHEEASGQWQHGDYHTLPDADNCTDCHGADFTGANSLVSCFSCHSGISALDCTDCHTGPSTSYTDSAHGNTSYGVDHSGTGYTQGDCTHCHDLPAGSTNDILLFAAVNPTSQTDNFCFQCHKEIGSVQDPVFNNYNYSYRASGDNSITCPSNILEAFSFIDQSGASVLNCGSADGSSHDLADITAFIDGKWGYTTDSNPCTACHHPHRAQRDPHTSGNRGWPVSRPSGHTDTSTWELWGDDLVEKMDQYTYQAPNADSGYEPDGSATQDGSNLTDYVTFCTDCHNSTNTIYSNVLDRNLKTIDWNTEKHGEGNADSYITVDSPYTAGAGALGYVLSCLDCHEPHGSPNAFLIREEVNGGALGGNITKTSTFEWHYLCDRCHKDDIELDGGCQEDHYYNIHHDATDGNDPCYNAAGCGTCHAGGPGPATCGSDKNKLSCIDCHFHGSSKTNCSYGPATRVTF